MFKWNKDDPDVFYIKQGDLLPLIGGFPEPAADIDLTGSTITFSMQSESGDVVINNVAASIVTATPIPEVSYTWTGTDTAKHGKFIGEFRATYATGSKPLSIPNFEYIKIFIDKRIGG